MDKRIRELGGILWPPCDAAEMRAWQCRFGSDMEIARTLGLNRTSVYAWRRRHGVAALPPGRRGRIRERVPQARMSTAAIASLYAGRRYEDRTIRPLGEGVAVRVDVPASLRRRAGGR